MTGRAAGGIFFSGSKAQRSEPFRKKMMPAAGPCIGRGACVAIVRWSGLLQA